MPRITRSQTKSSSKRLTGEGEITSQRDETIENAFEFEPDDLTSITSSKRRTKKAKTRHSKEADVRGTKPSSPQRSITSIPNVTKSIARQNYALPHPSLAHRHRGIPAHLPTELQTPRLLNKPSPFFNHQTTWTKSVANPDVLKRISRASSNNIGEGPIWELLEDRSWYKGCISGQNREVVYKGILLGDNVKSLSRTEAAPYLPISFSANSTTLQCFVGPFNNQIKHTFAPLQSIPMNDLFSGKKSHLLYAGGPVWAIDWCPVLPDVTQRKKQYLAIGPLPSATHSLMFGKPAPRLSPACIQIWSISPSTENASDEHPGILACQMIICVDNGPALDLKWCPLPVDNEPPPSEASPKKLGVLAGVFEDGSVSLYVVPDPDSLQKERQESDLLYMKIDPRLRIELPSTKCISFDWANSDLIAIGCSNGHLAIFQIKKALEDPSSQVLYPTHYVSIHQSAIRSVAWVKAPPRSPSGMPRIDSDPTVVLSGGYDGALIATDIRDLRGNVVYRTRDVINSIAFSHHVGGFFASDNENVVKSFSITPLLLGRGHSFIEPDGPIWSVGTSEFHPQLAVGSADGTCRTTNILKSTRKGGLVPFLVHKLYQLDFNRITGEFRLLENFLPYEYVERSVAARPATKKQASETVSTGSVNTGAWPPAVSVTKVVWNSSAGIARSPWLASATASGLCRLDWLLGRFAHDRFPYMDIQRLRREVEVDEMDDIEGDEDEDDRDG